MLKKKEEEKKKKAELEAAKQATQVVLYNDSETEEDSPRKIEVAHTVRQARVLGGSAHGRALFQELNQMSGDSAEAMELGEEIMTAYRSASTCDALGGETATVRGSAHSNSREVRLVICQ